MVLGIFFLNTALKKLYFLRDKMIFMHCSLQIKQNIYSIGIFRAPVVIYVIVKYKEKWKIAPFLKVYHFSISQLFPNVKVLVVQAVYLNKNKVGTKSLICQTIITNKVPNFPLFFYKKFA